MLGVWELVLYRVYVRVTMNQGQEYLHCESDRTFGDPVRVAIAMRTHILYTKPRPG